MNAEADGSSQSRSVSVAETDESRYVIVAEADESRSAIVADADGSRSRSVIVSEVDGSSSVIVADSDRSRSIKTGSDGWWFSSGSSCSEIFTCLVDISHLFYRVKLLSPTYLDLSIGWFSPSVFILTISFCISVIPSQIVLGIEKGMNFIPAAKGVNV